MAPNDHHLPSPITLRHQRDSFECELQDIEAAEQERQLALLSRRTLRNDRPRPQPYSRFDWPRADQAYEVTLSIHARMQSSSAPALAKALKYKRLELARPRMLVAESFPTKGSLWHDLLDYHRSITQNAARNKRQEHGTSTSSAARNDRSDNCAGLQRQPTAESRGNSLLLEGNEAWLGPHKNTPDNREAHHQILTALLYHVDVSLCGKPRSDVLQDGKGASVETPAGHGSSNRLDNNSAPDIGPSGTTDNLGQSPATSDQQRSRNFNGNGQRQRTSFRHAPESTQNVEGRFRCVIFGQNLPEERADCGSNGAAEHVSQLRRHHECHGFYYCLKCFIYFPSPLARDSHACVAGGICVTPQCSNYGGLLATCPHRSNSPEDKWSALFRLYHEDFRPREIGLVVDSGGRLAPRRRPRNSSAGSSRPRLAMAGAQRRYDRQAQSTRHHLELPGDSASMSGSASSSLDFDEEAVVGNIGTMSRIILHLARSLEDHADSADAGLVGAREGIHESMLGVMQHMRSFFHSLPGGTDLMRTTLVGLPEQDAHLVDMILAIGSGPTSELPTTYFSTASSVGRHNNQQYLRPSTAVEMNVPGLGALVDRDELAHVGMAPYIHITTAPTFNVAPGSDANELQQALHDEDMN